MGRAIVCFVLCFAVLILTAMAVVHRDRGDPLRGVINLLMGAGVMTFLLYWRP